MKKILIQLGVVLILFFGLMSFSSAALAFSASDDCAPVSEINFDLSINDACTQNGGTVIFDEHNIVICSIDPEKALVFNTICAHNGGLVDENYSDAVVCLFHA